MVFVERIIEDGQRSGLGDKVMDDIPDDVART
jgi:hypothetical protein